MRVKLSAESLGCRLGGLGLTEEATVSKYLVEGSYSTQGDKGLFQGGGGTVRLKAVGIAIADLGGKLESFYWTIGENNFIVIIDAPSIISVAALLMQVESTGAVSKLKATPLLTAEDIDAAVKMHGSYAPPGD
jgi:uncharacterized protein with GYD domain